MTSGEEPVIMRNRRIERLVILALEAGCRRLWGFTPRLVPVVVRTLGPARALTWFTVNMPRLLLTMHRIGHIRTHLAALAVSLQNGCTYCAYGHAYALELLYFRQRNTLFPVDAATLARWQGLPPHELRRRLRHALDAAGLQGEVRWVDTALALAGGARPIDRDEARLAHVVAMFARMTRIIAAAGLEPDQAQNPINKDARLKARHAARRAAV